MYSIHKIITSLVACFLVVFSASAFADEHFTFMCSEWPPFEFTGKDGKPVGYSVEILEAMMEEMDIHEGILIVPWARAYSMAQSTKNALVFTMARTKEREALFKWVGPIAPRDIYLWKLKDRTDINVETFDDIKNYRVGTVRAEAGEKQLIEIGFQLNSNIVPVTNQIQNYKKLYRQRVDFIYGLEISMVYGLNQQGLDPNRLEKSLLLSGGLEYYFGFNIDTSDETVEQFRGALEEIKRNGTFDKIVKKYKETA